MAGWMDGWPTFERHGYDFEESFQDLDFLALYRQSI